MSRLYRASCDAAVQLLNRGKTVIEHRRLFVADVLTVRSHWAAVFRGRSLARPSSWALIAVTLLVCSAHVGNSDVWYDGPAGPYSVRVLVHPPEVVPGPVVVLVRVRGGASGVSVTPVQSDAGAEAQPTRRVARREAGDSETFRAQLRVTANGAYSLVVDIEGARGIGRVTLPATVKATRLKPITQRTRVSLLAALTFVLVGMISIVGAAVRESVVPVGDIVTPKRDRRARQAMLAAGLWAALTFLGAWRWSSAVDDSVRSQLDRQWLTHSVVSSGEGGSAAVTLTITDSTWLVRNEPEERIGPGNPLRWLVPDHGKLVHMFLIRSDQAAVAHLHPVTTDTVSFSAPLPLLPAGDYVVFAELIENNGATRTLVDTVVVTADVSAPSPNADPDDAGWSGPSAGALTGEEYILEGGLKMRIRPTGALAPGLAVDLEVEVLDGEGRPAPLEPYMGMTAHAVVARHDGSVFVHLHPMGTVSMAAQQAVSEGSAGVALHGGAHSGSGGTSPGSMHAVAPPSHTVFPNAFWRPGHYRVWVQVRHGGRVLTGARDVEIPPPS